MADLGKGVVSMAKARCFALKRGTCQVLTTWMKKQCDGCSLHRTKAELDESLRVANMRLASLDKDNQKYIAGKYYDGEMPWLEGGK